MTPLLIVQNNMSLVNAGNMAVAARELEYDIHDCSLDLDNPPATPVVEQGRPVMIYGSVLFPFHWRETALSPWVFIDDYTFSVEAWRKHLGARFLNHDGYETTAGEFIDVRTSAHHVRPVVSLRKKIAGAVMDWEGLAEFKLPSDFRFWVSSPVQIDAEVRVWFVHHRPVAASLYRKDGDHFRSAEHPLVTAAMEEAEHLSGVFLPARHAVMDLALHDGEWKVIEFNTIHSSGLYAADPRIILRSYMKGYMP